MVNILLWRGALILFALLTVYFSVSYRAGHVGPDDFIDTRRSTADIAPTGWVQLDSDDWFQLAEQSQAKTGDLTLDQTYTLKALAANITSGRALARLADIYYEQGKQKQAEEIARLASRLVTAQSETHLPLSFFWGKTGKTEEIVQTWHVLFIREPQLRNALFPHMRAMARDKTTAHLVDVFAKNPPVWWEAFFNYLARNEQTPIELLAHLYQVRLNSITPLNDNEMNVYIDRLIKDKRWSDAHNVWLKSLPTDASHYTDLIYDGGFESEWYNMGFSWFFQTHKQVKITPSITFGMEGKRALKIHFSGTKHINFQHLWQRLLLKSAPYELTMRFRADQFITSEGLKLRIYCTENNQIIAESRALKESKQWITETMTFEIPPDNCESQLLRLEAASTYAHDQVFKGTVWLDSIQLRETIHAEQ